MDNRRESRYVALLVSHETYPSVASGTRNDKARYVAAIVKGHRETYGRCCRGQLGNIEYRYFSVRVPQKTVDTGRIKKESCNIARIVDGSGHGLRGAPASIENSDLSVRSPHKTARRTRGRVLKITSDLSGIVDAYNLSGHGLGDIEQDIACAIGRRRKLALRQGI